MFQVSEATVMIVEDHGESRAAFEALIAATGYHCASFASGEAFLRQPLPSAPCCLLLDMQLSGKNGLEVQDELNARQAVLPVLFVSGDDSTARAVRAMKAGAVDFLQKPCDPDLLLKSVEQALQISVLDRNRRQSAEHDAALLAELTQREHEILALLVNGDTNKTVARMLDISTRTVETHRIHIMNKLQARTLADLVRLWLNNAQHAD